MSFNTSLSKPSSQLWNQIEWQPSELQINKFIKLQSLLKKWNEKINLTRLIDGDDYWITHVFDSLWPIKEELKNQSNTIQCVDVGTGCGFPGLALAIALPKTKVTLIEAIKRKTLALKAISEELDLNSQIIICQERVEITGQQSKFRGKFDFAMARAVAKTPIVSEYLIPLLNKKGQALIYQGKWSVEEQIELNKALLILKGKIKSIQKINLPKDKGKRHVIRIIPTGICPDKYPRAIGIPSKRPLGN